MNSPITKTQTDNTDTDT